MRVAGSAEAEAVARSLDAPAGFHAAPLAARAEGRCDVLVAEVGGRVVGTGLLRRDPRDARVAADEVRHLVRDLG